MGACTLTTNSNSGFGLQIVYNRVDAPDRANEPNRAIVYLSFSYSVFF